MQTPGITEGFVNPMNARNAEPVCSRGSKIMVFATLVAAAVGGYFWNRETQNHLAANHPAAEPFDSLYHFGPSTEEERAIAYRDPCRVNVYSIIGIDGVFGVRTPTYEERQDPETRMGCLHPEADCSWVLPDYAMDCRTVWQQVCPNGVRVGRAITNASGHLIEGAWVLPRCT